MQRSILLAVLHDEHLPDVNLVEGALQEMASKGMSVVYSLGDEDTRKQLLDGLMGTLQGGQCVLTSGA